MPYLDEVLFDLTARLDDGLPPVERGARPLSRFAGEGASADHVQRVANVSDARVVPSTLTQRRGRALAETMLKALAEATPSAGGYLVPRELANEVLMLLRARSAVMRMNVTIVPVKKELAVAYLASGGSASYVAENARIPVSEQTFGEEVLLRPKQLAALIPVSNRLLRDASETPDVDRIIRLDLAEVLALRADLAFLRGTGSASEPVGIANLAGLTPGPDLGMNGDTPDYDVLKDTVAAMRAINAPFLNPGWIFHPRLLSTLEKMKDAEGRYLADAGLLSFDATGGGGTLLGFRFATTTQIPITITTGTSTDTTDLYFSSDWQECWVGENEEFGIEMSSEAAYTVDGTNWNSAFQQNQTLFRAVMHHDIGLRRPALFTVVTGVRP